MTLILGNIKSGKRTGRHRMRWLDGITDSMDMFVWPPGVGDEQGGLACCSPWGAKSRTRLSNWRELNWDDLSWGTFLFVGPFLHIKILEIKKHENPIWWGGTGRTRDMTRRLCPHGWWGRVLLSWAGPHLFTLSLATSTRKCSREPLKGDDHQVPHLPWLLTSLSHSTFSVHRLSPQALFSVASNLETGQSYK